MNKLAWCVVVATAISGCGRDAPRATVATAPSERLQSPPSAPYVMFLSVAGDDTFHHVSLASLTSMNRMYVTPLTCERVYFSAARGLCLNAEAQGTTTQWYADVFDGSFHRLFHLPLAGTPSRVRLSPNGRRAAATMFESGHEYDEHGFSTRTTIIDTMSGTTSGGDLEQFTTYRDGQPIKAKDFNFWGATFANDNDTFYATLQTASVAYLVKGSVDQRTMDVLRAGVECPSLSPDNTRIAFKKRMGTQSRGWWQIAVLQLDTMKDTLVSTETRSVDDQVEWLDGERVAYHLTGGSTAADLWAVRVDGTAPPELLRPASYSPAVVRQNSLSK